MATTTAAATITRLHFTYMKEAYPIPRPKEATLNTKDAEDDGNGSISEQLPNIVQAQNPQWVLKCRWHLVWCCGVCQASL
mmetsp:Transcript_19967/g.35590  ORF Transcript_19967/g.35590 Transcript_19967/m.35590 type:complete len:80 (+) Transcript_19967:372-611(+)